MKNARVLLWLLIPLFAILCVPFYNRLEPVLFGIPFFYAYQLLLIPVTAIITGGVYLSFSRKKKSDQNK